MNVFLSIGSNVDRERNIRGGLRCLRRYFGELSCSTTYRCAAVGFEGNAFYNLAVGLQTQDSPEHVVSFLKSVEDEFGRDRSAAKFSDRTLDIDLLLYGDRVIDQVGLHVPRDEILKYPFVLMPLAEIAPDFVHPSTGQRLDAMWQQMSLKGHDLEPLSNLDDGMR